MRHSLGTISSFSGFVQTMTQNDALDKLRYTDVHARYVENRLMNEIDLSNRGNFSNLLKNRNKLPISYILPPFKTCAWDWKIICSNMLTLIIII